MYLWFRNRTLYTFIRKLYTYTIYILFMHIRLPCMPSSTKFHNQPTMHANVQEKQCNAIIKIRSWLKRYGVTQKHEMLYLYKSVFFD